MKINKNSLIYMMSLFPILVSQVVYTIINSKFAIFLLVLKMFVFIYYFGKSDKTLYFCIRYGNRNVFCCLGNICIYK